MGTRSSTGGFTEADLPVAEVLGQRAAKAVENALLHQEVGRLAVVERDRAAELGSVLSAIGEGIVIFDPDGTVRSMNAAATRMLGGDVADEADIASAPERAGCRATACRDVLRPPGGSARGHVEALAGAERLCPRRARSG